MASRKNYCYVLVFTESGPKYVTSIDYSNKVARWHELEKPLPICKSSAEDLVFGLNCNFTQAVLVTHPYEIMEQPYRYEYYSINFTKKEL